jgi:ribose transport system substrate-binding protein
MKKLIIPALILAAVMLLTSYTKRKAERHAISDAARSGQVATTARHTDQLYVEVSALGNLDYFYDHKVGMRLVGKTLGVETDYVGPAEFDMAAMVAAFEQTLARENLKGIVVVGFEETLEAVINKAIDMGIPVVTVDADLPESDRIAFVGTGNYKSGLAGGRKMAELIGEKGKIALMTRAGQSNLIERIQGYEDALKDFPDVSIVQVVDTQSDPLVAAQVATAVLQLHPDLAGLGCVEGAGGAGAAAAVREAGLAGKVKIVSMDRGQEVLDQIEKGVISASIAQQTALMPFYAVQILYTLANTDIPMTTDNAQAGVPGVPAYIDTGVIIVDETNYRYFMRD